MTVPSGKRDLLRTHYRGGGTVLAVRRVQGAIRVHIEGDDDPEYWYLGTRITHDYAGGTDPSGIRGRKLWSSGGRGNRLVTETLADHVRAIKHRSVGVQ